MPLMSQVCDYRGCIKGTSQIFSSLTLLTTPESHNNSLMRALISKLLALPVGVALGEQAAVKVQVQVALVAGSVCRLRCWSPRCWHHIRR